MNETAAKTLAERRRHQLVEVPARPGEELLAHVARGLLLNLSLLFGDLLADTHDRRIEIDHG